MTIPLRSSRPGTFFVTSATASRKPIFASEESCRMLVETLGHYRGEGHYLLHDFVIMPDHIHLLITPRGQTTLERSMQLIKGGFSRRHPSKFPVWQRGFTDHRVRDKEDFLARRKYIYGNPVEAGLVQSVEEYPFSSAYRKSTLRG